MPTTRDPVGLNRIRFLTAEPVDPATVRTSILASWQRSRDLQVAADRIEQPYRSDPEADEAPLTRAAEPVLRGLRTQLDGQPMSIILTDPSGLVLSRQTGDRDLARHLDRVMLAPGFSYAEQTVGTNGIGTALEVAGPTHVFGHEHYAENLEDLACAAVPVRHPISGRTVCALDLTCWARDAGPLLMTLARTTAVQIRQALMADTGVSQVELLQEYLRTCHRIPGIVFAVSGDVVMLNEHTRTVLDPVDQAALVAQAREVLVGRQRASAVAELPSGIRARMHGVPVGMGQPTGGVVVHVKLVDPAGPQVVGRQVAAVRVPLPGLVGTAPIWLRAGEEVSGAARSGEWIAVTGEPGVGKLALLRAVHRRLHPKSCLAVVDVADAGTAASLTSRVRDALSSDTDTLVIAHLDRLGPARLRRLARLLADAKRVEHPPWVAATLGTTRSSEELDALLQLFPSTVEVPPLRFHLDDLEQLVPHLLDRLCSPNQLAFSPDAMAVLLRGAWPGNVDQVLTVLRHVVEHRRTGTIRVEDLPPEARTVSRRRLSQLESLERDAIVQALCDTHGDKSLAARSLGMSRATIYRKIREYGIVHPVG